MPLNSTYGAECIGGQQCRRIGNIRGGQHLPGPTRGLGRSLVAEDADEPGTVGVHQCATMQQGLTPVHILSQRKRFLVCVG